VDCLAQTTDVLFETQNADLSVPKTFGAITAVPELNTTWLCSTYD